MGQRRTLPCLPKVSSATGWKVHAIALRMASKMKGASGYITATKGVQFCEAGGLRSGQRGKDPLMTLGGDVTHGRGRDGCATGQFILGARTKMKVHPAIS